MMGGISEILSALFDGLTEIRRADRAHAAVAPRVLLGLWVATGITAVPLWLDFRRFFDASPAWAVLVGGLWFLALLMTLAMTVARISHAVSRPPS